MTTRSASSTARLLGAWLLGMVAACHAEDDGRRHANARPREAIDRLCLCDGRPDCEDFNVWGRSMFVDGNLALNDCASDQTAALYGDWRLGDAGSHLFDWQGEARRGAVFPVPGRTAVSLLCTDEHWQIHSPYVALRFDPDGFEWARLTDDDVFIPFRGEASIDDMFVATATLDAVDGDPAPHLTVSVTGADGSATAHGDLEPGDAFPWGGYRAQIVRIVAPQETVLGALGWVEVHLSEETGLHHGPASP